VRVQILVHCVVVDWQLSLQLCRRRSPAAARCCGRRFPVDVGWPPELGADLRSEVAWLVKVSRAFAGSPLAGGSARDVDGVRGSSTG
jgi:hypothetical protein